MRRYGGIFERGSREYTLDDFYSIQLDKMDRFVCLKKNEITIAGEEESSSSDDEEDSEDDEDDDSEVEPEEEIRGEIVGDAEGEGMAVTNGEETTNVRCEFVENVEEGGRVKGENGVSSGYPLR